MPHTPTHVRPGQQQPGFATLGNTPFNVLTGTRASNVAQQQFGERLRGARQIGGLIPKVQGQEIQRRARESEAGRLKVIQEQQEDIETAVRFGREDVERFKKRISDLIAEQTAAFNREIRENELAMGRFRADVRTEAVTGGVQEALGGFTSLVGGGLFQRPSGISPTQAGFPSFTQQFGASRFGGSPLTTGGVPFQPFGLSPFQFPSLGGR